MKTSPINGPSPQCKVKYNKAAIKSLTQNTCIKTTVGKFPNIANPYSLPIENLPSCSSNKTEIAAAKDKVCERAQPTSIKCDLSSPHGKGSMDWSPHIAVGATYKRWATFQNEHKGNTLSNGLCINFKDLITNGECTEPDIDDLTGMTNFTGYCNSIIGSAPSPQQTLAPSPQQTLAPSPQQTLAPSPQQTLAPSPQQTLAPSPQQTLAPSPQQPQPRRVGTSAGVIVAAVGTPILVSIFIAALCKRKIVACFNSGKQSNYSKFPSSELTNYTTFRSNKTEV